MQDLARKRKTREAALLQEIVFLHKPDSSAVSSIQSLESTELTFRLHPLTASGASVTALHTS